MTNQPMAIVSRFSPGEQFATTASRISKEPGGRQFARMGAFIAFGGAVDFFVTPGTFTGLAGCQHSKFAIGQKRWTSRMKPEANGVQELRERLKNEENCVFLDRDAYSKLAISNRDLVRADTPEARVRGVMEPATGQFWLIEDEKLFAGG
jgi:hypothetical protein